jgi:hypothetical protein
MFVEFLRALAESLGYIFHYGRSDFNNLFETESDDDPNTYLFLDPVTRAPVFSQDSGLLTNYWTYTGKFLLLSKSDLDQEYDQQTGIRPESEGKWSQNIHPKVEVALKTLTKNISCSEDQQINRWLVMDVINLFDENMDGVMVEFEIRFEEK